MDVSGRTIQETKSSGCREHLIHKFIVLLSLVLMCSCTSSQSIETKVTQVIIQCEKTRPNICTMDYRPVCATRDNGIRCVTTPCLSTETATYSNGCSACADSKVLYYVTEECEQ